MEIIECMRKYADVVRMKMIVKLEQDVGIHYELMITLMGLFGIQTPTPKIPIPTLNLSKSKL